MGRNSVSVDWHPLEPTVAEVSTCYVKGMPYEHSYTGRIGYMQQRIDLCRELCELRESGASQEVLESKADEIFDDITNSYFTEFIDDTGFGLTSPEAWAYYEAVSKLQAG